MIFVLSVVAALAVIAVMMLVNVIRLNESRERPAIAFSLLVVWLVVIAAYYAGKAVEHEELQPTVNIGQSVSVIEVYLHPADGRRVAVIGWREGKRHRITTFEADKDFDGGPFDPGNGPLLALGDRLVLMKDGRYARIPFVSDAVSVGE